MIRSVCIVLAAVIIGESKVFGADKSWTDGCGVSSSCFALPAGCLSRGDCVATVSVAKKDKSDVFLFEMESVGGRYVAVGLSDDSKMGGDSVAECVYNAGDGTVNLFTSYNRPGVKANNRMPTWDGVNFVNGSFVDGILHCKFTREVVTDVFGSVFDLINNEFYLLLACGSTDTPSPVSKLTYHNIIRGSSGQPRRLSDIGMFV